MSNEGSSQSRESSGTPATTKTSRFAEFMRKLAHRKEAPIQTQNDTDNTWFTSALPLLFFWQLLIIYQPSWHTGLLLATLSLPQRPPPIPATGRGKTEELKERHRQLIPQGSQDGSTPFLCIMGWLASRLITCIDGFATACCGTEHRATPRLYSPTANRF